MRKLLLIGIILIFTLIVCAVSVMLLQDRTILVPPPEQATESFFRQIQLKRYSRALPLLEERLKQDLNPFVLKELKRELESKVGEIQKVKGKEGNMKGEEATAIAQITGKTGSIEVPVKLVRQHGVWKVNSVLLDTQQSDFPQGYEEEED